MLFLLRIPGWLVVVLGFVLSLMVGFSIAFGLLYIGSPSCLSGLMAGAPLIIFFIVDGFVVDRCTKKWHSAGLRYAKHARDNGFANHAEKAAVEVYPD